MFLLDSSAWLAHLLAEPGVEQVNALFDNPRHDVYISTLSIPEVYGRLKALGQETHWPEVWQIYQALFTKSLPVNEAIAHQAIALKSVIPERLPTIDGLIAATAVVHKLTLVHRDPHFANIPFNLLSQTRLPPKV
ncbi:MAG TPA: type II toxin-antitoxin system VapC family toxin [Anaerolineae bacterium]|nr:type II toxin-antitoxin system VapC family toxin [Anaerolineae bacterium]HIP70813.1 type II toxin-antitoxin system VapC family toxin [Anaerolineae bacterium]